MRLLDNKMLSALEVNVTVSEFGIAVGYTRFNFTKDWRSVPLVLHDDFGLAIDVQNMLYDVMCERILRFCMDAYRANLIITENSHITE